MVNCI